MRYGTIPVARASGGLAANRHDVGGATGILYAADHADALGGALRSGLDVARDRDALLAMRQNAMRADFSWEQSARQYLDMYRELGV